MQVIPELAVGFHALEIIENQPSAWLLLDILTVLEDLQGQTLSPHLHHIKGVLTHYIRIAKKVVRTTLKSYNVERSRPFHLKKLLL